MIDGFCGSGGNVIQFSKYCSKVYAIDIDPKKIEICKNNCKIYNCKDNIYFIEYDFLKIEQYKPMKVFADFIFLSPPWGGIKYKNSDIYSIKASMTPDISEIIKVCLRISKHIMFYVPRTLMIEELFEIISKINKKNRLFFDIHILKSANKIKALLIIFGYDIDKKVDEKDISEYLNFVYGSKLSDIYIKLFSAVAKIIGNFRFFENEMNFRKNLEKSEKTDKTCDNVGKELFNYFFNLVFTTQEKIKIKSLKIYSQLRPKNKNKKENINNINILNDNQNIINSIYNSKNEESPDNFIIRYTIKYIGDNNEYYLNLKDNKHFEDEKINDNDFIFLSEKNNLSNCPSPTISTSPSSSKITLNNMSLSIIDKNLQDEWTLTSCHEINLNYIPK
jgi:16S rRNA G966 N2-methylase RsmD